MFRYPNYLDLAFNDRTSLPKKKHATMGPAEYIPPNPQEFLRKHSKQNTQNTTKSKKFERCCAKHEKRPPIPNRENYKPQEPKKNIVKEYVKKMDKTKPRQPAENIVSTKHGDKAPAKILEPQFIHSKNYGKYPRYLLRNQHERGKLLQSIKDEKEMNQISNCRYVTRQEREALFNVIFYSL